MNEVTNREQKILDIIDKIMESYDVPKYYYSFLEPLDDAYCIEKQGNYWMCYNYQRGQRCDLEFFDDITKAGAKLFVSIIEKENSLKALKDFKVLLNSNV